MKGKWEFYQDGNNKWNWIRTTTNGNIIDASTQGYVDKADCIENAREHGYDGQHTMLLPNPDAT